MCVVNDKGDSTGFKDSLLFKYLNSLSPSTRIIAELILDLADKKKNSLTKCYFSDLILIENRNEIVNSLSKLYPKETNLIGFRNRDKVKPELLYIYISRLDSKKLLNSLKESIVKSDISFIEPFSWLVESMFIENFVTAPVDIDHIISELNLSFKVFDWDNPSDFKNFPNSSSQASKLLKSQLHNNEANPNMRFTGNAIVSSVKELNTLNLTSTIFIDWLLAPSKKNQELNNLEISFYLSRPDLHLQFGIKDLDFKSNFYSWFRNFGMKEFGLEKMFSEGDLSLLEERMNLPSRIIQSRKKRFQRNKTSKKNVHINMYGFFDNQLGLSKPANDLFNFFVRNNYKVNKFTYSAISNPLKHENDLNYTVVDYNVGVDSFPINIIFANWTHTKQIIDKFKIDRGYTIGAWFWELEKIPEDAIEISSLIDRVWVFSKYNFNSFANYLNCELSYLPPVINTPQVNYAPSFNPFASYYEKYFFYNFDFLSDPVRKNPLALISSFQKAFPHESEKISLIIKSINGKFNPNFSLKIIEEIKNRNDIFWIDSNMSNSDFDKILTQSLAYVSPHRAEGLGLGMLQALSCGVPVIATNYSGNLDFMDHDNSILVKSDMVSVQTDEINYTTSIGATWASIDITNLSVELRRILQDKDLQKSLSANGKKSMEKKYSLENIQNAYSHEFNQILGFDFPLGTESGESRMG